MNLATSAELYIETRKVEYFAIRTTQTLRPISELVDYLRFRDPEALIEYLDDKDVLDVGSGCNGLAIDVLLRDLPIRVTPINPSIWNADFEDKQKATIAELGEYRFPGFSPQAIEAARVEANRKTLPLFAHDLSDLPDNAFDVVIDNASVFYYTDFSKRLALIRSLHEMRRVCRGNIRVGDFSGNYGERPLGWKETLLRELGIIYRPYKVGFEIPNCGAA